MRIKKKKKPNISKEEQIKLAQESVPIGWIQIEEGQILIGDRLWMYGDGAFTSPCEHEDFLLLGQAEDKWCVIRKKLIAVTKDHEKAAMNRLIRIATRS